jgi:FixJ family two-component response regulator
VIYIVEDDSSVRRSFEIFLEAAAMKFKSFRSAESFLEDGGYTNNDLLLLDINLPQMSGLDLLNRLSADKKHINAIVITSLENEQIRESCRGYGVKAFLRKPVDGEALLDLIKYNIQS